MKISAVYERIIESARFLDSVPLHRPSQPLIIMPLEWSYSTNTIKREFSTQLGTIVDLDVRIADHGLVTIVIDPYVPLLDERVKPVIAIMFKDCINGWWCDVLIRNKLRNVMREEKIETHPSYSDPKLLAQVYKMIAYSDRNVVATSVEFEQNRQLWVELAKDPNCFVWLADPDSDLMRDADGEPIRYTGQTSIDDRIWFGGRQYDDTLWLIVLTNYDIRVNKQHQTYFKLATDAGLITTFSQPT